MELEISQFFFKKQVFCGSSPGNNPVYVEVAKKLGKLLAEKNVALVYGGGNLGIMGALASSVSENGGKVIGIIPSAMVDLSGSVKNEERIVVPDMHTRKRTMLAKSDALLALPGGFGTAEELFEGKGIYLFLSNNVVRRNFQC